MTHWRTPHTDEEACRLVHLSRMERWYPIACGVLIGPLVAILFVLAVIWLAGIIA